LTGPGARITLSAMYPARLVGVTLRFTTPCCNGYDTPQGLPAVIAAIHNYTASLIIHFTPRR
jgi:hypothetical protein